MRSTLEQIWFQGPSGLLARCDTEIHCVSGLYSHLTGGSATGQMCAFYSVVQGCQVSKKEDACKQTYTPPRQSHTHRFSFQTIMQSTGQD